MKLIDYAKKMLASCTISYYLGYGISNGIDPKEYGTSYFDPMHNCIKIGMGNIVNALNSNKAYDDQDYIHDIKDEIVFKTKEDEFDFEKTMRNCLYHETLHVLLTPSRKDCNLFQIFESMLTGQIDARCREVSKEVRIATGTTNIRAAIKFVLNALMYHRNDFINIFEDQRIETIGKGQFMNTDFYKNVFRVNGKKGLADVTEVAKDTVEKFYQIIRYRKCDNAFDQEQMDEGDNIIDEFWELNSSEKDYNKIKDMCRKVSDIIINIYFKYFINPAYPVPIIAKVKGQPKELKNKDKKQRINAIGKGAGGLSEQANEYKIKGVEDFDERKLIIDAIKRKVVEENIANAAKRNAYFSRTSGKFDVRSYIRPNHNKGRIFKKISESADTKANCKKCKKVLNLWLDGSGSYGGNCEATNKIISLLIELNDTIPNFQFNLICLGGGGEYDTKLLEGDDRYSRSSGGTDLDKEEMNRLYPMLNNRHNKTLNLVLFDGWVGLDREALALFNNNKSHFIIDKSVEDQREEYAPESSYEVVTDYNYADHLTANVAKALDKML